MRGPRRMMMRSSIGSVSRMLRNAVVSKNWWRSRSGFLIFPHVSYRQVFISGQHVVCHKCYLILKIMLYFFLLFNRRPHRRDSMFPGALSVEICSPLFSPISISCDGSFSVGSVTGIYLGFITAGYAKPTYLPLFSWRDTHMIRGCSFPKEWNRGWNSASPAHTFLGLRFPFWSWAKSE